MYARGTAPLNDFLRDQEIDRVIQAGVDAKPSKYFGLQLTGNFDRSTGLGQISGEPPAYGPLTWPLVTGTVYVNFPKAGRLSVDLQRTYYIEQIIYRQQLPGEPSHSPLDPRFLAWNNAKKAARRPQSNAAGTIIDVKRHQGRKS